MSEISLQHVFQRGNWKFSHFSSQRASVRSGWEGLLQFAVLSSKNIELIRSLCRPKPSYLLIMYWFTDLFSWCPTSVSCSVSHVGSLFGSQPESVCFSVFVLIISSFQQLVWSCRCLCRWTEMSSEILNTVCSTRTEIWYWSLLLLLLVILIRWFKCFGLHHLHHFTSVTIVL